MMEQPEKGERWVNVAGQTLIITGNVRGMVFFEIPDLASWGGMKLPHFMKIHEKKRPVEHANGGRI
jgi:hypothetical protein